MSIQEQQDLEKFKAERAQIQDDTFRAMRDIIRSSETDLKTRGYKTREQGVISTYKFAQERIDKLFAEYLRKYPD